MPARSGASARSGCPARSRTSASWCDTRRAQPAELVQRLVRLAQQLVGACSTSPLHRVQRGERVDHPGDGAPGWRRTTVAKRLAARDRLVDRRRAEHRRGRPPAEDLVELALVAGAPRASAARPQSASALATCPARPRRLSARSDHARHSPWSSPARSSTGSTASATRSDCAVRADVGSASRRTNSRSIRARVPAPVRRSRARPRRRARLLASVRRPASNSEAPSAGSSAPRAASSPLGERDRALQQALAAAGSPRAVRACAAVCKRAAARAARARSSLAGPPELALRARTPARGGSRRSRRRPRAAARASPRHDACNSARMSFGVPGVGRLADQRVGEAKRVLAGELGPVAGDQALAREADEPRHEVAALLRRSTDASAPAWNVRPSTARVLQQRPSSASSRSMRAASTAWMLTGSSAVVLALVDGDELLDEQRVALGALRDPRGRDRRAPSRCGELARLRVAERVEHENRAVGLRRRPRRARLEQLGAGQADEQDRGAARERRDVVEQRPAARAAPSGCPRSPRRAAGRGEPLQQPPQRPCRLLGLRGLVGDADRREHAAHRPARRRRAAPRSGPAGRRRARGRCRPARGTSCPRRRPGSGPASTVASSPSAARNSPRQARLADPGRPGDRDEPAARSSRTRRTRRAARRARRSRPTNGVAGARSSAGASACSSTGARSRRRSRVGGDGAPGRRPSRISPAAARSASRPAA